MLIVLALLAAGVPARTFRVDYVHSGTASEERFALDDLYAPRKGLAPGSGPAR